MKKTTEAKIRDMVNRHYKARIEEMLKEMVCEHKWRSAGYGYECTECKRYTGLHQKLNNLITELLKKKV